MENKNNKLIEASNFSTDKVLEIYSNTLQGFEEDKIEEQREKYGENKITNKEKDSFLKKFIMTFMDPFTLILIGLAIISYITDVILAPKGQEDPMATIIVLVLVLLSSLVKFVQETKSTNAAEKLSEMVKITTRVKRKYNEGIELPLDEVVVGDIIYLAAGDMIPADVRILQAKDLFISQSALTGENEPIEKYSQNINKNIKNPLELSNIAFMGSNVISGSGICIVINVGNETFLGGISKKISEKRQPTSFEKGLDSVSNLLIKFIAVMVPIVFFINGFTKGDWIEAFLFAISVAVGLTPEMMPMIVTTNLAKGSIQMAKNKTIVKNLNSMQNFGAMDILCTDKTGTLTEDKVVLEFYLDTRGNIDKRVLRHSFLNSYFQTGLKNLIDIAVISHIDDKSLKELSEKYTKVDEIPFDFNRRLMSVVIKDKDGKTQLITKGAVEEMLKVCSHVEFDGKVLPMQDVTRADFLNTVDELNNKGMRVIAIAQKTNPAAEGYFSVKDEKDMVLMGYLAFLDPPKKTSGEAIKALNEHGVTVKVLTGDNDLVTKYISNEVGLKVDNILLGSQIETMDDDVLSKEIERTSVFAKLSPIQKERLVKLMKSNGHIVGFMGDGINDAPALKASDVGISVDTAVDIAKESSDIILLEKDLMVLEQGVVEGRKTFANMIKYIKMTASSNFGNIFSVLIASAFVPFLPMLPIHLLILNLIYDISCIAIPWDNVDDEYTIKPQKWNADSIGRFMIWFGPISSIFDILTFGVLFFVICPSVVGAKYSELVGQNAILFKMLFNTGWFVESLWSQTFVIHMLRTSKLPFIKSIASWPVITSTIFSVIVGTILPYTIFGLELGFQPLPISFFVYLIGIIILYMALISIIKSIFIKKFNEFL